MNDEQTRKLENALVMTEAAPVTAILATATMDPDADSLLRLSDTLRQLRADLNAVTIERDSLIRDNATLSQQVHALQESTELERTKLLRQMNRNNSQRDYWMKQHAALKAQLHSLSAMLLDTLKSADGGAMLGDRPPPDADGRRVNGNGQANYAEDDPPPQFLREREQRRQTN